MTFDEILRPQTQDQPIVSRVSEPPRQTQPRRETRPQDDRGNMSAEPHWPRVFPGL